MDSATKKKVEARLKSLNKMLAVSAEPCTIVEVTIERLAPAPAPPRPSVNTAATTSSTSGWVCRPCPTGICCTKS